MFIKATIIRLIIKFVRFISGLCKHLGKYNYSNKYCATCDMKCLQLSQPHVGLSNDSFLISIKGFSSCSTLTFGSSFSCFPHRSISYIYEVRPGVQTAMYYLILHLTWIFSQFSCFLWLWF